MTTSERLSMIERHCDKLTAENVELRKQVTILQAENAQIETLRELAANYKNRIAQLEIQLENK